MCFWRDVTERQQLVEELEQRGRLIDLAHDAIIVREPVASTVTYWNREATQMYGYSAEEAKGRITHDLLATRFPESREAVDQPLLERGRWDGELSHLRADGRRILVSSRQALVRGTRDEALAVIELNADITESKRAEEELRAAEERFPRLIESAPDAMVIVNQDGVIELVLLHQLEQALVPRIRIGPRWRLAWRYHPAVRSMLLGGDFIGACERGDGSLALLIGDVAGHDTASRRRAPGRHSARRGWARPKATRRSSRSRCSFTAS